MTTTTADNPEYRYRSILIIERGDHCYVPALNSRFPHAVLARAAIDLALVKPSHTLRSVHTA